MNDRGQVSPNTEKQGLHRSQWLLGSRSTALLADPPPEPNTSRSSIRMFRKPSPIEYTAQHMSQRRLGKSLCRFAQIGEVCPNLKTCPYNHDRRWFRYEPTRGMWDFMHVNPHGPRRKCDIGEVVRREAGDHWFCWGYDYPAKRDRLPPFMRRKPLQDGPIDEELFQHDVKSKTEEKTILLRDKQGEICDIMDVSVILVLRDPEPLYPGPDKEDPKRSPYVWRRGMYGPKTYIYSDPSQSLAERGDLSANPKGEVITW